MQKRHAGDLTEVLASDEAAEPHISVGHFQELTAVYVLQALDQPRGLFMATIDRHNPLDERELHGAAIAPAEKQSKWLW